MCSKDSSKPLLEHDVALASASQRSAPFYAPQEAFEPEPEEWKCLGCVWDVQDSRIRADGLSREEIGAVREILGISRPGR